MAWQIFGRWFNLPPTNDAVFITDNQGEKFWISWRDRFERTTQLHIWYRGREVGVIKLLREKGRSLTLADIVIFERLKHTKLRGRGLGTAMMQELIRWAKENSFTGIWGFSQPDDKHHWSIYDNGIGDRDLPSTRQVLANIRFRWN